MNWKILLDNLKPHLNNEEGFVIKLFYNLATLKIVISYKNFEK